MSSVTSNRHIIWSDMDLDIDKWREGYEEYLEANDLHEGLDDESALTDWMYEINSGYLEDERMNLDIQLSQKILVIADLGLWDGRRMGYKEISSGNIKDCLYPDTDFTEIYVDKFGDLRADATHHDGINHYLYRVYKDSATEKQKENLKEKIYRGTVTKSDISRVTRRLGDEFGKVYGWDFPKPEKTHERLTMKSQPQK